MTFIYKALTAAAVAAVVLVTHAGPAAAATPCWKKLLNDWYDGRIDNVYPIHCYQDTLKHLPADISVYSSAREDIQRALQSARAKLLLKGQKPAGPNALVPAETTSSTSTQTTTNEPDDDLDDRRWHRPRWHRFGQRRGDDPARAQAPAGAFRASPSS